MNKPSALTITSIILSPFAVGIANAQTAAAAAGSENVVGLEEVVITAQRREESSQRAAIAINTISGDDIVNANVTRPGQLTNMVPALQVSDDTGPYSGFYVRGVGNFAANSLSDPALTFNFDGVTVMRAGTSGFFYDLERVEVLKGPQGTLYGRNATGGAINVISKRPAFGQFGADASVDFGNYASFRADGMLNVPLGQSAALRVAAFHTEHDGYMNDGSDDQNDSGGRLTVALQPSDSLDISLVADYFKQGGQAAGSTVIGTTDTSSTLFPTAKPNFTADDRFGLFSPQVTAYLATQPNGLNGRTFAPFVNVNHENNRFWGVSSTIDWTTSVGTLTLIPAYRDSRLDYTSFAVGTMLREENQDKQTSLEVRFASPSDQALRYVVGAFYFHDSNEVPRFDVNQQSVVTFFDYTVNTDSRALFSSLTYAIAPAFRLTGGVRYTKDEKDLNGTVAANQNICAAGFMACPTAGVFPYTLLALVPASFPPFTPGADGTFTTQATIVNSRSASFNKVTWRAGVDFDITDQNLLYANVETGFKAGGFFFSNDYNVYDPESIRAYTLGSKNRFLDNKLQLNIEAFYWKYKDQQISHLGVDSQGFVIFPTENVGVATYKGIEIDLQARPFRNTLVSADVQYEDGVYDDFVYHTPNLNSGFGNGTDCHGPQNAITANQYTVDCSGKRPPFTPEWSVSAGVQQTIPLPGGANLVGNARVHYQSETLTALEFLPVEYQSGYSIWDFDFTYATQSERFSIGAYVNNAFDKTAVNFSFPTPFGAFATGILQHPRTYGVRMGVHF